MTSLRVTIEPLTVSDVDEVMEIESQVFKTFWPYSAFVNEITQNHLAHYFVARHQDKLVGYAGEWLVIDEAHITTIAVHPQFRQRKIGEQLLIHLLTIAVAKGSRWATLEVRESNQAAQEMYKKFGFVSVGVRKNYYMEEHENAVVMWSGNLRGELYKSKLAELKRTLENEMVDSV